MGAAIDSIDPDIAEYLAALDIDLKEVRVVGDEERAIVDRNYLRFVRVLSASGTLQKTVLLQESDGE